MIISTPRLRLRCWAQADRAVFAAMHADSQVMHDCGGPISRSESVGSHVQIGWRLMRHAWGFGYATEAARAALTDTFVRVGLDAVIAYTAADNLRSQAVMTRLKMRRDPSRDFTSDYAAIKGWRGLVWEARSSG